MASGLIMTKVRSILVGLDLDEESLKKKVLGSKCFAKWAKVCKNGKLII